MSDILNYQFQDPMQTFLKMSQFGSGIAQQRAAGVMAQASAAEAQAKLEAARVAAAAEAERQAKVDALMDKLGQPGATLNDYLELAMYMPKDQAKAIQDSVSQMRDEEKAAALSESAQIFSAFKAGRPDIAVQYIRRQAEAERAAGKELGAKTAEQWARMIESGEDGANAVENMFGFQIALMPGGDKAIEAAIKLEAARRAAQEFPILMQQKEAELSKAKTEAEKAAIELKYADQLAELEVKKAGADLGLTEAQTKQALANADKLSADAKKALLENEAEEKGGLTVEKRYALTDQLRGEYVKRTGQFTELRSTFDTIKASALDASGAGDLALVTGFMKMLDPDSVVRETEFANARETSGLLDSLRATAKKLENGQFLSPQQRKDFAGLAAKYMEAASKYEKEIRSDLEVIVQNRGLNADEVFGRSRAAPGFGTVQPMQAVEEVDF